MSLAPILGRLSTDCSTYTKPDCYTPCEHEQEVIDYAMSSVIAGDEYLTELIKAQLKLQANFIKEMCEWTPTICQQGERLGFPCVQCGLVSPAFGFNCESFECSGATYQVINPCISLCGEGCTCVSLQVDFSSTAEGVALYEIIITALQDFDGLANWSGIEAMAKAIFGIDAAVVAFQNGTYYLDIGRVMTEFEMSAINIIKQVFPVPIGSTLQFIERVC